MNGRSKKRSGMSPDEVKKRLDDYKTRAEWAMRGGAIPSTTEAMVPVRAHFRRQHNYLNRFPEVRAAVSEIIRGLLKAQPKGGPK